MSWRYESQRTGTLKRSEKAFARWGVRPQTATSDESATPPRPCAKRAAARPGPATPQRMCNGCAFTSRNSGKKTKTDLNHSTEQTLGFGRFGQERTFEDGPSWCGVNVYGIVH